MAPSKRYFQAKPSAEIKESIELAVRELSGWAALDVMVGSEIFGDSLSSEILFTEDLGVAAKGGRPPRILLVDSRLRFNPDQTGKILKHQDGFVVHLEVRGSPVALFFIGFDVEEVNSRDAYAAIFNNEKRTYKSAFSQAWNDFWANEARAAKTAIQTVANFEEVIAKGVHQYSELSTEEKQVVNCTLAAGGGSGFAVKAVANVALRTTATATSQLQTASATAIKAEPLIKTPAVEAANARALARSKSQNGFQSGAPQAGTSEAIKELEVREVFFDSHAFDVPASDLIKIYGEFDPRKVIKEKNVPTPPVITKTGRRYKAHLEVGEGRKMPVEFEIVSSPTPRGFVTIRFENPLHRGVTTERSIRQSELELSPGFRDITDD